MNRIIFLKNLVGLFIIFCWNIKTEDYEIKILFKNINIFLSKFAKSVWRFCIKLYIYWISVNVIRKSYITFFSFCRILTFLNTLSKLYISGLLICISARLIIFFWNFLKRLFKNHLHAVYRSRFFLNIFWLSC